MTAYAIMSADGLVCAGVYSTRFRATRAMFQMPRSEIWDIAPYHVTCPKCGVAQSGHHGLCDNHEENQS